MNSIYKINKGINRPIEFKGLKAQYIWYLGIGVILLLVIFAISYISGLNVFACLGLITAMGTLLFVGVYKLSDTYGEYGLLKKLAKRNIPDYLNCHSRKVFTSLSSASSIQNPASRIEHPESKIQHQVSSFQHQHQASSIQYPAPNPE